MLMEIAKLLEEKNLIELRLENMIFGAIEVRETGGKKFIYVHYREGEKQRSQYVGEYSEELYNLIQNNNNQSKAYKKRLREIKKDLSKSGYIDMEVSDDIVLNIDYIRKHLSEIIYSQALLEGIDTSFTNVELLVNGEKINRLSALDTQKLINLKRAWEFILFKDVAVFPDNLDLMSQINAVVENGIDYLAGSIRTVPVSISGTSFIPPTLSEKEIVESLNKLNNNDNILDKAIDALLFVQKNQLFLNGNKRTAFIFANHMLLKEGHGFLMIPADLVSEYKKHLINYYEFGEEEYIKSFIKEQCLRNYR